jgi:hypothetical protein
VLLADLSSGVDVEEPDVFEPRSAARSGWLACAAAAFARTTRRLPPGSE